MLLSALRPRAAVAHNSLASPLRVAVAAQRPRSASTPRQQRALRTLLIAQHSVLAARAPPSTVSRLYTSYRDRSQHGSSSDTAFTHQRSFGASSARVSSTSVSLLPFLLAAAGAAVAGAAGVFFTSASADSGGGDGGGGSSSKDPPGAADVNDDDRKVGHARADLPWFGADEVAKHNSLENGLWVTYGQGVYDVSEFVESHPGGPGKLMLAVGGPLEAYWAMYAQHRNKSVRAILEMYRIGNLKGAAPPVHPDDMKVDPSDPYAHDPARSPKLRVRSQRPFNAEPSPTLLVDHVITPNEYFYVRNHLPVPKIDLPNYAIEIGGEGIAPVRLTLDELRRFPKHEIVAAVQCAGNRRDEMSRVRPVRGGNWDESAISNARWGGARLRDVLAYAGLDVDEDRLRTLAVRHVWFEGLDHDPTGTRYGASIPLTKAISPTGDVLLAYEMNGEALPLDHGFPVRALVPGVAGARSVKWLNKITASKDESPSHWQRKDYKAFAPAVDWHNVNWETAPAIQAMPVTSAVCDPPNGAVVTGDEVTVRGYAWSGGGRAIIRVDVSSDNGKTWTTAQLQPPPALHDANELDRTWGWSLWSARVPVPKDASGEFVLTCKATDSHYNSQPDRVDAIWNLRGVLNNSWHRVNVKLAQAAK